VDQITPEQKIEVKTPDVSVAKGAHGWLVIIGCTLIVLFAIGGIYNRSQGSETKETTYAAKSKGEKEEKTTETKSVPSDTILVTLLGAGATLILVGFLYARISAIKGPGGFELDLLTEKDTAATAAAVVDKAQASGVTDPTKIATATTDALTTVAREKAAVMRDAPTTAIEQAAEASVRAVAGAG
jgi:hypothetical protein